MSSTINIHLECLYYMSFTTHDLFGIFQFVRLVTRIKHFRTLNIMSHSIIVSLFSGDNMFKINEGIDTNKTSAQRVPYFQIHLQLIRLFKWKGIKPVTACILYVKYPNVLNLILLYIFKTYNSYCISIPTVIRQASSFLLSVNIHFEIKFRPTCMWTLSFCNELNVL